MSALTKSFEDNNDEGMRAVYFKDDQKILWEQIQDGYRLQINFYSNGKLKVSAWGDVKQLREWIKGNKTDWQANAGWVFV